MNYYPHHIGDFDRATRHLTRIERSIYRDLLDVYYETEQPITLDLPKLKRKILANTEQESTAVEQVLNEFFTETPTGWFHSRCDEEILAYQSNSTQKSVAGKASAAARAARKHQALNGNSTDVATPVEQTLNGTSTNQEPITINHKPVTKDKKAAPSAYADLLIDVAPQVVNDWKEHRRTKKAAITRTVIEQIKREAVKAGFTLEEALVTSCNKNWVGFDADWLQPKTSGIASPNKQEALEIRNRAIADRMAGKILAGAI